MAESRATLSDHVVLCNVNERVRAIVDQLRKDPVSQDCIVALVVQDAKLWSDNPHWHPAPIDCDRVVEVLGVPTERAVLRQANISQARAAIILSDPNQGALADARSTLIGLAIEQENPQVHTVMELLLSVNRSHLRATALDEVVCLGELSEKLLSQSVVTPGVSRLFAHLLTAGNSTAQFFLSPVPQCLVGSSYREVARRSLRNDAPYVVCGFLRRRPRTHAGLRQNLIVLNPRANQEPGKDSLLDQQDSLVLIATAAPDLSLLEHAISEA